MKNCRKLRQTTFSWKKLPSSKCVRSPTSRTWYKPWSSS